MNESMRGAVPHPAPTQPEAGPGERSATSPANAADGREQPPAGARSAALGVRRTPTGNDEVDARLERLSDLDHLAADGHIEVYEDVHRGLRDTLTALDSRPGPPAPPTPHEHRS